MDVLSIFSNQGSNVLKISLIFIYCTVVKVYVIFLEAYMFIGKVFIDEILTGVRKDFTNVFLKNQLCLKITEV